jgi:hypothetical protein
MLSRRVLLVSVCFCAILIASPAYTQHPPPASGARILLLPRQIVSGERATLAVLDVNGRLTPGVTVNFSNGDHLTTDATGRAQFAAPLNPGAITASISGRPGRLTTSVVTPPSATTSAIEVTTAPRVASVTDRFELTGRGFCGDADTNKVMIAERAALVLAASPASLIILPPGDLNPGPAKVEISCAKRTASSFSINFLELELEADASPLKPGKHRELTVRVRGTSSKVTLEARNLAPEIAELAGGNPARVASTGGTANSARFDLVGRTKGNFLVSIRLVPYTTTPHPAK